MAGDGDGHGGGNNGGTAVGHVGGATTTGGAARRLWWRGGSGAEGVDGWMGARGSNCTKSVDSGRWAAAGEGVGFGPGGRGGNINDVRDLW